MSCASGSGAITSSSGSPANIGVPSGTAMTEPVKRNVARRSRNSALNNRSESRYAIASGLMASSSR